MRINNIITYVHAVPLEDIDNLLCFGKILLQCFIRVKEDMKSTGQVLDNNHIITIGIDTREEFYQKIIVSYAEVIYDKNI